MSMIDISTKLEPRGSRAFEKFWQIRRAINLLAGHELKSLHLSLKQALVVFYLGKQGKVSQADLSRHTGTDPAAMARTVAFLIQQGWVAQHDHPVDRRRWELVLTAKGKMLEKKVKPVFKLLEKRFFLTLSIAESHALDVWSDKVFTAYSQK